METSKNVQSRAIILLTVLFSIHVVGWLLIPLVWGPGQNRDQAHTIIGATYGLVTLVGGFVGLSASKRWGGAKSYLGKALLFLSVGLLLTEFGQLAFSYYNIFRHVDLPYPSIADIGFVGAIPMYVLGSFYLFKTLNVKNAIKNAGPLKTIGLLLIPLALMVVTYLVNFKDYSFEGQSPLVVFLDFTDPIGHLLYLSLTLMAITRARSLMGGILRRGLIVILVAFIAQYLADMNFLYQDINQTWQSGNYGDFLYMIAYTLMSLGIIGFNSVKLKTTPKSEEK